MCNLERLGKIVKILIVLSVVSGAAHVFYAAGFFFSLPSFIEYGMQSDMNLVFAYLLSLIVFAVVILLTTIARAVRKDVTEEMNYLYSEIGNLAKKQEAIMKMNDGIHTTIKK